MWRRLKVAQVTGQPPMTHGGVVAQVWRGGSGRQALLARAMTAVEVDGLDEELGRRAGVLLARTGSSDAIDAAVAALAIDGDQIVTSDVADLHQLVIATGRRVDVVPT
ncbi:MAG: twitching motility protein PilT [Actinomycetota bacterium]|nr:twitching motility protein PilT [Actinomycetota bacterium]